MDQVRDYVRSLGYWVNTRMIRGRISQWNLQRNNQMHDMVSALRLLNPNPALWPAPEPNFLIRGREIGLPEILRFFRRKGIHDPIEWSRSAAINQDAQDVSLLPERAPPETATTEGGFIRGAHAASVNQGHPLSMAPTGTHATPDTIPRQRITILEYAVASLRDYCIFYFDPGTPMLHEEPQVHQFTSHGRFGDRMQEGLAQMVRYGNAAFPNFRRAFDLIQPILSNCQPMSIAQILAIVCQLSTIAQAQDLLVCLLQYLAAMARTLQAAPSLVQFLRALSSSPSALLQQIVISSLRGALSISYERSPQTWHRLYIHERLCDCLYHGRDRTEGSTRRAQLLGEQEMIYGPFARNVLWTATNVADDLLSQNSLGAAEEHYMAVLARADRLSGFPQAKLRYAALEGLGRVYLRCFERLSPPDRFSSAGGDRDGILLLQNSHRNFEAALHEALTWFEQPSRRVTWIKEQEQYVRILLQRYSHVPNPP